MSSSAWPELVFPGVFNLTSSFNTVHWSTNTQTVKTQEAQKTFSVSFPAQKPAVRLDGSTPPASARLAAQFWSSRDAQSHGGVFPRGRLLLQVRGPLDAGLPALGFALGLGELNHKEGQDNHSSQEGKHGDGLTHFLVVAPRHYP